MTNAQSPMNAQCPMTNVMTGHPRESGAKEPQRHCPVGRPRQASSATVPCHWPLAIGHSLVIGYWPLFIGRQSGSIEFVNRRGSRTRRRGFLSSCISLALLLTLTLLGTIPSPLHAASRDAAWKNVEDAISKGLP